VQERATEAILDGRNAIVLAPTAGGKTEAAFFPVPLGAARHPRARRRRVGVGMSTSRR
jgi:ATP-dependent Lhr-like helicase